MTDTNVINHVGDVIQAAKAQWQINGPTLMFAAAFVVGQFRKFNDWCLGIAEFVIRHGGIFMIAKKLIWNPEVKS